MKPTMFWKAALSGGAGILIGLLIVAVVSGPAVTATVFAQVWIALFGVAAIFLTQADSEHLRKWACIAGLIGQPGWYLAAYLAAQWGILALSVLYTLAWLKGFYTHWINH